MIGKRKNLRLFHFGSYEHFVQAKFFEARSASIKSYSNGFTVEQ